MTSAPSIHTAYESDATSPRKPGWLVSWICFLAALALAAGHFYILYRNFGGAISTPDANGYFAQARHIAEQHQTSFTAESPLQYIPMHWVSGDGKTFFSKYPPGLPLIAAAVRKLASPEASLLVNPIMGSLTLLGLFLVGRAWIGPGWALLAAALMAINAEVNQQAMFAFAHTAVAFFLVWALFAVTRWERGDSRFWAFAAGLFFGIIPTIRYAETLYLLGPLMFVLFAPRSRRPSRGSVLAGLVGIAIPTGALAIRNQLAFGAFWRTGYAASNEQTGFGLGYFLDHFASYLSELGSNGAGLAFALGLVGLTVLCCRRDTVRRGLLLTFVVVPATLLYMAYYWGGGGGGMRFLVPTFFIYALGAAWLLKLLGQVARGPAIAAALVTLAVAGCTGIPASLERIEGLGQTNRALADLTKAVRRHVPAGDIILADNQVQQQLDFAGDWRLVDPQAIGGRGPGGPPRGFDGGGPTGGGRRPIVTQNGMPARRRGAGRLVAMQGRGPGGGGDDDNAPSPSRGRAVEERLDRYRDLEGSERSDAIRRDLFAWAGKGHVFWVGESDQLDRIEEQLGDVEASKALATVEVRGMRGFGPGMGRGPGGPGFGRGPGGFGPPGMGPPGGDGGPGIGGFGPRGFGGGRGGPGFGGRMRRGRGAPDADEPARKFIIVELVPTDES